MRIFIVAVAAILCVGHMAVAAQTKKLPRAMMYEGHPIAPYCVSKLFKMGLVSEESVDLAKCLSRTKVVKSDPHNTGDIIRRSPTSYAQVLENDAAYYDYIGELNGVHILRFTRNTGGSGYFSMAVGVRREGDVLAREYVLGGGDRCNGGIGNVAIEGGRVLVDRLSTPADFLWLSGVDPHNLEAYKDLEASAASCFASARYDGEKLVALIPDEETLKELVAPELDTEWVNKYKYQACFNKFFIEESKKNKKWTPDQLKSFMETFNTQCVEAQ
jgi:hypothetical protein